MDERARTGDFPELPIEAARVYARFVPVKRWLRVASWAIAGVAGSVLGAFVFFVAHLPVVGRVFLIAAAAFALVTIVSGVLFRLAAARFRRQRPAPPS